MTITALSRSRAHAPLRRAAFEAMSRSPGLSGADLEREVRGMVGDAVPAGDWPGSRTFRAFVEQWNAGTTEAWELEGAPAGEVAAVLRAHRAALDDPLWFRRWPSRSEAEWITRLTQAAPAIDPALAYRLAVRAARDTDCHRDVLAVLAFGSWTEYGSKALIEAVVAGRVPRDVAYLAGLGTEVDVAIQTAAHPKVGRRTTKGDKA